MARVNLTKPVTHIPAHIHSQSQALKKKHGQVTKMLKITHETHKSQRTQRNFE